MLLSDYVTTTPPAHATDQKATGQAIERYSNIGTRRYVWFLLLQHAKRNNLKRLRLIRAEKRKFFGEKNTDSVLHVSRKNNNITTTGRTTVMYRPNHSQKTNTIRPKREQIISDTVSS